MAETSSETPEWMLLLENKKKRHHKLAHEIGAGAPCITCGDACPGLDLHFWRKLCRNCKCKKEEHDVQDEDDYGKFEILLGTANKRKKHGAFLKINVPEAAVGATKGNSKEVSFDWIPPNVSDDVAAEYMQKLPTAKLPISGSDGALYRRQQLEKQVPLHDVDANHCHNLTPEEVEGLKKYLENLKSNVVGQGRVTKVPLLLATTKWMGELPQNMSRPLSLSQSADSLRSFATPRPFHPSLLNKSGNTNYDALPPPLPDSLPPNLKKPSSFLPPGNLYHQSAHAPAEHHSGISPALKQIDPLFASELTGAQLISAKDLPVPGTVLSTVHSKDMIHSMPVDCLLPHHSQNLARRETNQLPEVGMVLKDGSVISSHNEPASILHSSTVPGKKFPPSFTNSSSQYSPQNQQAENVQKHMGGSPVHSGYLSDLQSKSNKPLGNQSVNASVVTSYLPTQNLTCSTCVSGERFPSSNSTICSHMSDKYQEKDMRPTSSGNGDARLLFHDNLQTGSSLRQQDGSLDRSLLPKNVAQSSAVPGEYFSSPSSNSPFSASVLKDGMATSLNYPKGEIVYSNKLPIKEMASSHEFPNNLAINKHINLNNSNLMPKENNNCRNIPDSSYLPPNSSTLDRNNINPEIIHQAETYYQQFGDGYNNLKQMEAQSMLTSSVGPHGEIVFSEGVASDSLPKASIAINRHIDVIPAETLDDLSGKMAQMGDHSFHLDCKECGGSVSPGEVAVFADRAGDDTAWHPSCFVCSTCKELLVDLIYFYIKGNVYCGRHFAEMLNIPRCFACDELIFVNEYTMAEEKAFHVRHFCCFECDVPLGGMKYIPVDGQPVCLDCFQEKYGKKCHKCKRQIAAGDQRVSWKDLHWHVSSDCFQCFQCHKSLLGGRFVVKENQPFCSKECVLSSNING